MITDPRNYTIIAVETDLSISTGYREIFSTGAPQRAGVRLFRRYRVESGPRRFTDYIGGPNDPNGDVQQGVDTITNPSRPFILSGLSSSTDAIIYQNSTVLYDAGGPIPTRNVTASCYIGVQGSLGSEYCKGDIAELLIYNGALSQSSFNTDIGYLSDKWLGTPEPGTLLLFAAGMAVVWAVRRRAV